MTGDPRDSRPGEGQDALRAGLLAALKPPIAPPGAASMDSDWLEPPPTPLSPDAHTSAAWLEEGLRAHGRLALGAQLSLGLLALAAPPTLVDAAQVINLADLEHARRAFGAAHALGGARLGPQELPIAAPPEPLRDWVVGHALGSLFDLRLERSLAREDDPLWRRRLDDHEALAQHHLARVRWLPKARDLWAASSATLSREASWRLAAAHEALFQRELEELTAALEEL